ncbi:MAG: PHP domain-containing protein [Fidelibacterota bacterium]
MKGYSEYIGAIHIHTIYSDGTAAIPEIIEKASEVGLNFLMFSDHHSLKPKIMGFEGWHGGVLVLIGYEINDEEDKNHYLVFDMEEDISFPQRADAYVKKVNRMGGLGIVAHPDERRHNLEKYPPYPWTEWNLNELIIIEIWNQMSQWMEGLTRWNKVWRYMHPRSSLKTPTERTLRRWDGMNKFRKVVGVGGIDAHAHIYYLFNRIPLEIFPYKVQFKSIRTHIWTEKKLNEDVKFPECKEIIYSSIKNGRCFISNYRWGNAKGFKFWAESGGSQFISGDTIARCERGVDFFVKLPEKADIFLIKDGEKIYSNSGRDLYYRTDEGGIYRVEVLKKKRGWIYSNHMYLKYD